MSIVEQAISKTPESRFMADRTLGGTLINRNPASPPESKLDILDRLLDNLISQSISSTSSLQRKLDMLLGELPTTEDCQYSSPGKDGLLAKIFDKIEVLELSAAAMTRHIERLNEI